MYVWISFDLFIINIFQTLRDVVTDKNLKYRADYNISPSHDISFILFIPSTSGVSVVVRNPDTYTVNFLFLKDHQKLTVFFSASGVQIPQTQFDTCKIINNFPKLLIKRRIYGLEGIGVPSVFKLIRKVEVLSRM